MAAENDIPLDALADSSRQRPAGGFDEFSAYPPIADYAFLSDCEVTALVAPSGSVEWMCLPKMDGPSVFGSMLDRDAGWFRFGPDDVSVPSDRRYLPGTMVLETSWDCGEGWLVVRECLVMGPWQHDHPDGSTHIRPPTDYDAEHMLLRTVRCVDGQAQLTLDCVPAFDYGRQHARWRHTERGYTQAVVEPEGLDLTLTLTSDIRLGLEGSSARGRTLLKEGDTRFCALSWGRRIPESYADAYRRLVWTAHHWQHWLSHGRFPDHRWRGHLARSALTLKGLTFAPTGAIAAAATTSLPETPGGERNWDYRYTWMRDATFTLQALHILGLDWEAEEFMQFVADLEHNEDGALQIMYGVDGRRDLTETTRDDLSGYAEAKPVRVGNGAFDQHQNDVFGAVLDSILNHTNYSERLPRRLWPIVESQAECATEVWKQPDQGIWEARGEPQHYVSSKLMCWVALDRASKLAGIRDDPKLRDEWGATAEEIRADILENGLKDGILRQHYGTDALDASTLLAAIFGFLPGDDERLRKSVEAIADDLTEHGFVLRYLTDETDDGLSGKEGTFLICSFWLVSALAIIGEQQRATDLMERLLRVASPLGLYAEEYDADTGRHLGNFPQAFSHLALIEAAERLIVAEQVDEV